MLESYLAIPLKISHSSDIRPIHMVIGMTAVNHVVNSLGEKAASRQKFK